MVCTHVVVCSILKDAEKKCSRWKTEEKIKPVGVLLLSQIYHKMLNSCLVLQILNFLILSRKTHLTSEITEAK